MIGPDDRILITGASGYIGTSLLEALLELGCRNIRCLVRPASNLAKISALSARYAPDAQIEVLKGNLLSRDDCAAATRDVAVIYHLAAGTGGKSFPDAFLNSVVTTRNLIEASLAHKQLRRFVNISSFAVYTNRNKPKRGLLDESCPTEPRPQYCEEAYCYGKVRQDDLVIDYGNKAGLPYVILRPGIVYGPGKYSLSGRIGLGTFGIFLHFGGFNRLPFTYLANCAYAIALAGLKPGIDREVFNVVDDDLPTSSQFLRQYKKNVRSFRSIYVPKICSYLFCLLWEKLSDWSDGQLPEFLNRRAWHAYWKGARYSNTKIKNLLGWEQIVPTQEGFKRYFEACRTRNSHA